MNIEQYTLVTAYLRIFLEIAEVFGMFALLRINDANQHPWIDRLLKVYFFVLILLMAIKAFIEPSPMPVRF